MSAGEAVRIQASHGKVALLSADQRITVINTHGTQVIDTWAFNAHDLGEHMSMAHSRSFNSRIYPAVGDSMVSNRRRPMLTIVEDSSPGVHDTLLCACNRQIYQELGIETYHRNCEDNLAEALREVGLSITDTPNPLNLFMNTPVVADGSIDRRPPVSKPGDYIVLRAEMDLVIAFSACPQDVTPINGPGLTPRDVHYRIE
jgi:uncharacterized protein YcgI (DUF1989 family)